jgi:hypothetical protein
VSWTVEQLHEELAAYYAQYRGATAPENTFTKSLWDRIALAEDEERAA